MDPKLVKTIAKIALSILGAVVIGYAMKAEHKIEEKIDAHYDTSNDNNTVTITD